jgi:hypothetical protein
MCQLFAYALEKTLALELVEQAHVDEMRGFLFALAESRDQIARCVEYRQSYRRKKRRSLPKSQDH